MRNRIIFTLLIFSLFILSPACDKASETIPKKEEEDKQIENICDSSDEHEDCENDYFWDTGKVTTIELNGRSANITGSGASAKGEQITITSAGNYEISGNLFDGQIMVATNDEETVRLIFNGVDIRNSESAPVFIADAEKTIVILAEGTKNYLTDNASYVFEDPEVEEPNATLYSNDDLSIYGEGTLFIDARYNDGINSKEGLIIKSGNINIAAKDDGMRGKDYLIIKGGNLTVDCQDDGLKSDNTDNNTLGYIAIKNGTTIITSGGDAIQAQNEVKISGGNGNLISGGGTTNASKSSAKGIQADSSIIIDDGIFTIQSGDHAIYSDNTIIINGGTFEIESAKDAIHAKAFTGIYGGNIKISKSNEGIESAVVIIENGQIEIVSENDGINISGNIYAETDEKPEWFSDSLGSQYLSIRGGYLAINAIADGIDVNGSMEMTGGTVLINGPETNDNGIIDFDGTFEISGGLLVGTGNPELSQKPDNTSTQHSLFSIFSSPLNANSIVHIESSESENILTFKPSKGYQCLVFSSPELKANESYSIYLGGSTTGDAKNGLFEDGDYSEGTLFRDFTTSDIVTTTE